MVLGNGSTVAAKQQGDNRVRIKIRNNGTKKDLWRTITIRKVLFVPDLAANLMSCSALCLSGYNIKFKRNYGRALVDRIYGIQILFREWVYVIHAEPNCLAGNVALAAKTSVESLWHQRLGHADLGSIRNLARPDAVTGLDLRKLPGSPNDCVDCILVKLHKCVIRTKLFVQLVEERSYIPRYPGKSQ